MNKWWFTILCWVLAAGIMIYANIILFIDEKQFTFFAQFASIVVLALMLFVIGVINSPKKDKDKNDK